MKRRDAAPPLRGKIGTLAVFGVGLIGGSLALALKKQHAVTRVIGVGRGRPNLLAAKRLGIIDEIASEAAAAARVADLILIAVPLGETASLLARIAPHLRAHTIITDAGSTKRGVIAAARATLGPAFSRFVPAHPIAGREKSGAVAAQHDLFEGRSLIVTPHSRSDPRAVSTVTAMWRCAGMRIVTMKADLHDRVFALVSHLPHVLAFALVDDLARRKDAAILFRHTGGGFRDFTRIAGSSPEMWRDICLANRDELTAGLDRYMRALHQLRRDIAEGRGRALEKRFAAARGARTKWITED